MIGMPSERGMTSGTSSTYVGPWDVTRVGTHTCAEGHGEQRVVVGVMEQIRLLGQKLLSREPRQLKKEGHIGGYK